MGDFTTKITVPLLHFSIVYFLRTQPENVKKNPKCDSQPANCEGKNQTNHTLSFSSFIDALVRSYSMTKHSKNPKDTLHLLITASRKHSPMMTQQSVLMYDWLTRGAAWDQSRQWLIFYSLATQRQAKFCADMTLVHVVFLSSVKAIKVTNNERRQNVHVFCIMYVLYMQLN